MPTVTFHGGALLSNVEVQGVYVGSRWNAPGFSSGGSNPVYSGAANSAQANYLGGFLYSAVTGPYLQMLHNAGYNVNTGTKDAGLIVPTLLDSSQFLTDSSIRAMLQAKISDRELRAPDANRLYVVFVEDNVAVQYDSNFDSTLRRYHDSMQDFLGYHGAFAGQDAQGSPADIRYAVIPYAGGTLSSPGGAFAGAGNLIAPWLAPVNSMTVTASHELAEAVTDPDLGYRTKGWYDDNYGEEIGDVCNFSTCWLNGYAVQRIVAPNDKPMTPWTASAERPVNFVLTTDGNLYEEYLTNGTPLSGVATPSWSLVATNVRSVSDQSIDLYGRAMIDYITNGNSAYEFHDRGGAPFWLASGVLAAVSGQGVSYVLASDNSIRQFRDASATWALIEPTQAGVTYASLSAGTDQYGANALYYIQILGTTFSDLWMDSDMAGVVFISGGSSFRNVSGGTMGAAAFVDGTGTAYTWFETSGTPALLQTGVSSVTIGTDATGHYGLGVVLQGGTGKYLSNSTGSWVVSFYFGPGTRFLSKSRGGMIDVVFRTSTNDWGYLDAGGWHNMTSGVRTAV